VRVFARGEEQPAADVRNRARRDGFEERRSGRSAVAPPEPIAPRRRVPRSEEDRAVRAGEVIVVGVDPHKKTHTAVAVSSQLGELRSEVTVKARAQGHAQLMLWARALDAERVFALEDCRHVSGALERFLISHGERVVRVPPKLMGEARKSSRSFGKSDPIDALAVARAALREPNLPEAHLEGPAREIALLVDHREDLVAERTRIQNRLRWHLHDIDPELDERAQRLQRSHRRLEGLARRLACREQTAQVRVCRDLLRRLKALSRDVKALEAELEQMVGGHAEALLKLPGCGTLTAAKLIAEVAGVERFASDAKLAKLAGVAPLDASSGKQQHHRLNRKGNRQLNCALHRLAVTQGRVHAPAREFLARKQAEGRSRREALRWLKRHLARVVFRILRLIARPHPEVERLPLPNREPTMQPLRLAAAPLPVST
jgi:transposase